jgi:hypothetical protein
MTTGIQVYDDALRLLGRALAAGAVVELAGRALARVDEPGAVNPEGAGPWLPFLADEAGTFACCPLWQGVPGAILSPGCHGWLRLGGADEPAAELLPVAEWLAGLGPAGARALAVGLLHGLDRIAAAGAAGRDPRGARPLIRSPESLARALFG